jgi:hypothetical protein
MIDCNELAQIAELKPPASPEALAAIQQTLGRTFPAAYVAFLRCTDGMYVPTVISLYLYATGELAERNATYEVPIYLPDWLLIGSDGGGRGILLDCASEPGTVYIVGLGSLRRADAEVLAPDMAAWARDGFAIESEED